MRTLKNMGLCVLFALGLMVTMGSTVVEESTVPVELDDAVKAEDVASAPKTEPVIAEEVSGTEAPVEKTSKAEPTVKETPQAAETPKAVEKPVAEATEKPTEDKAPVVGDVKPPETDAEAGEAIGTAIDLAERGAWTAFVGFVLMLVVWFLRRIKIMAMIPPKAVPWVTMALGCLTAVGLVFAGGQTWGNALVHGIGGGLIAPTMWEMLFKHVDRGKAKAARS